MRHLVTYIIYYIRVLVPDVIYLSDVSKNWLEQYMHKGMWYNKQNMYSDATYVGTMYVYLSHDHAYVVF